MRAIEIREYRNKRIKNFERVKSKLEEFRRARCGGDEIRIITNQEILHTQFS